MKRWTIAGLTCSVLVVCFLGFASLSTSGVVTVFDPQNFMQNIRNEIQNFISATNSYTQVANQVSQLSYEIRNVVPLTLSLVDPLFEEYQQMNRAIESVKSVGYSLTSIRDRYVDLYENLSASSLSPLQLREKIQRLDLALREENLNSILFQGGIVQSAPRDLSELGRIMARSREAQGNLEATQATNELVGQLLKQEIKTQEMVALHSRVISSDIAQRQAEEQAARAEHSWNMRNWSKKSSASPRSDFP
jgi:type IV secretion system protein TrbJ